MQPKDDWHKPRSHGQHLTAEEIEFIREAKRKGRRIPDVARALKCASRTVTKYYGLFHAEGGENPRTEPTLPKVRFYESNFEPT